MARATKTDLTTKADPTCTGNFVAWEIIDTIGDRTRRLEFRNMMGCGNSGGDEGGEVTLGAFLGH